MTDLVIFGTSSFARIVDSLVEEAGRYRVVAFTVDACRRDSERFLDRPVVAFEELESHYPPDTNVEVLVAVGYSQMNEVRRIKYEALKAREYRLASYVSPRQHIPSTVELGEHVMLLDENSLQPFCRLGNNVILWSRNVIGHEAAIDDHCFLSSGTVVGGHAKVGKGCFFGISASVSPRVTLGDRVFLGPGAVAGDNLADESVLTGPKSVLRKVTSRRLPPF
jgi:sugar O-acyltransferase (sialic acid O-acetyltransferase NeuD family)